MTDKDKELEENIKFLSKCCHNEYNDIRIDAVLLGSLDLITRKQAEIERLTKSLELVKGAKCVYSYDGETLEYCIHSPCPICKTADQIKSEAVKEFAERLKDIFEHAYQFEYGYLLTKDVINAKIDNLVKEMVGENNDG